ncbi:Asp23/Gls24 family envelope stress response protein [Spirillospora sp. CA-253888]
MSDLDQGPSGSGGEPGRSEVRSMPFFPGPPGSAGAPPPLGGTSGGVPGGALGTPSGGTPLAAPTAPPSTVPPSTVPPSTVPPASHVPVQGGRHAQERILPEPPPPSAPGPSGDLPAGSPSLPGAPAGGYERGGAGDAVQGRITIEDDVVERIAALAALEVGGVAALGGRAEAGAALGAAQGARPGVRVHAREHEMALDLVLTVEYGSVIMDVARAVKANVARVVGLMLGTYVASVNVVVEDVRAPGGSEIVSARTHGPR